MNRRSDLRDDDHRLPLDDRHQMGCLYVDDLKLGVNLVVSLCHRMNDLLDDRNLDDDRHDVLVGHRMNVMDVPNDLMTDGNLDASRDLRMSYRLDDRNLDDDRHDVLGDLR